MTSTATQYWQPLADGRVQCDVCPRHCRLHDGQRGLCYVRGAENGQVRLYTHGRSSGFCIDPIEKKPLNHFLPGTSVLSFGTAGCNLACRFCQNWDMSKSREMDTLSARATPEALARAAREHGARSVAFTYNDPVIFLEYALDVAAACAAADVRAVAVTAGYVCAQPRRALFAAMDATNIDLKGFSEAFYWKTCGAHLDDVLETIRYVARETDVHLEVTTLLIPGHNDADDELRAMSAWMAEHAGPDVPWHFTAFHPDWKMRDVPATPPATLQRARAIAMAAGMRFVYTGNVHDSAGGSTWCPGCGACVIERDWYQLGHWGLQDGACAACGEPIPGLFEAQPGSFGRQRIPLRIG